MEQRYKNLFIDLDNTLYDFTANSRDTYCEVYQLLHYERFFPSFEAYFALYEPHNTQLWLLYGDGKITKEELNRLRYAYPLEAVGAPDAALAARFCREALSRMPYKKKLVPHALELLQYLQPRYRLFILSNGFHELQARKMHSAGIDGFFERVVLSDDIGVNKPHRELFDYALQVTASRREESLMIGDHFEVDIVGAHNAGIDQLLFNREGRTAFPFSPTYTVASLAEVPTIL